MSRLVRWFVMPQHQDRALVHAIQTIIVTLAVQGAIVFGAAVYALSRI